MTPYSIDYFVLLLSRVLQAGMLHYHPTYGHSQRTLH